MVRNEEKGKALVTELAEFKNDDIHLVYADLANLATVRTVKSQLEKLNIKEINHAIFNAGVFHGHAYSTTKDNLEKHFGMQLFLVTRANTLSLLLCVSFYLLCLCQVYSFRN